MSVCRAAAAPADIHTRSTGSEGRVLTSAHTDPHTHTTCACTRVCAVTQAQTSRTS
jgi:hypothetical protein